MTDSVSFATDQKNRKQIILLDEIPGIGEHSAERIEAEAGTSFFYARYQKIANAEEEKGPL